MTSSILPQPTTARVIQVSPKETIIYDMPRDVYELVRDVLEWRAIEGYPKSQRTVAKALESIAVWGKAFDKRDVIAGVIVKREPTKPEIKGLRADSVWYDEFGFYEEGCK